MVVLVDVIAEESDEKMIEFAIGGVCNCCLDKLNKELLLKNDGVELAVKCLSRSLHSLLVSILGLLKKYAIV